MVVVVVIVEMVVVVVVVAVVVVVVEVVVVVGVAVVGVGVRVGVGVGVGVVVVVAAVFLSDAVLFQWGLNQNSMQSAMNNSYPVNLRNTTPAREMMRHDDQIRRFQ